MKIRALKVNEYSLMEKFLYDAIYQEEGKDSLPFDIIYEPNIYIYIKDFGKDNDLCLVADFDGEPIGAVWCRFLSDEPKGYGYVDDETPELSISVSEENRGKGIGKALLLAMIDLLEEIGYGQVSLSVQKENYASRIYLGMDFEIVKETDEDYVMLRSLG